MTQALTATIQTAWQNRWNQRIETAMSALAEVQTLAGWSDLSVDGLKTSAHQEEFLEALLLKSSLLRAQGLRQKSSALLAKILAQIDASAQPRSFRLLFELGVDHWIDHDIAKSLEFFLLAERKARNDFEKLFAASNVLWCLEDLDIERSETEKKVEQLLDSVQASEALHVQQLWEAYRLRRDFYCQMVVPLAPQKGQADFFQKWVLGLPYMQTKKTPLLSGQDYLWQGSYRLRTLTGIWVPGDQHSMRVSDAIDRIYLWTWWLMAGRSEINREKVFYVLDSILQDFEFENQNKENRLLLRNSLGWLQLLYPSLQSRLHAIFQKLSAVSSANYPLLEAEFDLIEVLNRKTPFAKTDSTQRFSIFPAFKEIYQNKGEALPLLREALTPTLYQQYDLIVDASREEIIFPSRGKTLPSKGLTKLFCLLMSQERVAMTELESFAAANLLYRARKLLGPDSIRVHSKNISRGPEWPRALVLSDIDWTEQDFPAMTQLGTNALPDSEAHLQAAKALFPQSFRRKDLESKLKISKATANRMLEKWLQDKKITVTGKAKAILYTWTEMGNL